MIKRKEGGRMHKQCFDCDRRQVHKIIEILDLDKEEQKELNNKTNAYLEKCNQEKTNPEIMGELWKIIKNCTYIQDPYYQIKQYYNHELFLQKEKIHEIIHQSNTLFYTALKISILGNIIDFSPNHSFDMESLMERIRSVEDIILSIDDSDLLYKELESAKTVLYIGDNCGELVLDKIFIEILHEIFPDIDFYYGVRGCPIVNDNTRKDALSIGMDEVAIIKDNGDGSLGTVLNRTGKGFQTLFYQSDVIISKGQGNYEGLMNNGHEHLFFLFMAKCSVIATPLGVPLQGILCMKNRNEQQE